MQVEVPISISVRLHAYNINTYIIYYNILLNLRGGTRKVGDQEGEAKPLRVKAGCVKACCAQKFLCVIFFLCKAICGKKGR